MFEASCLINSLIVAYLTSKPTIFGGQESSTFFIFWNPSHHRLHLSIIKRPRKVRIPTPSSFELTHTSATHSSLEAVSSNNEGKKRLKVSSSHHLSSQNLALLPSPMEKTKLPLIKGHSFLISFQNPHTTPFLLPHTSYLLLVSKESHFLPRSSNSIFWKLHFQKKLIVLISETKEGWGYNYYH